MEKEVKISPELEQRIARNVKLAMRDEVKEEARETARATARQVGNEISAETSECINALNYRIAHGEKRHSDGLDELKQEFHLLREVVTQEFVAKEPPEEKPTEEEPELEPLVGICPNCPTGFTEEDRKDYKYCPKCGALIKWD